MDFDQYTKSIDSIVDIVLENIKKFISQKYNIKFDNLTCQRFYIDTDELIVGIRIKIMVNHNIIPNTKSHIKDLINYISYYIDKTIADKDVILLLNKFANDHGGSINGISDTYYESANYAFNYWIMRNFYVEFKFKNMIMFGCDIEKLKKNVSLVKLYDKCYNIYEYMSKFIDLSKSFYNENEFLINCYDNDNYSIFNANLIFSPEDDYLKHEVTSNMHNVHVCLSTEPVSYENTKMIFITRSC